uniref:Uncharacterized protein n=1 Tax=Timema tahoe TaxID=61484 RepID=A0A7R9II62_9NEOP|nr:unnamed protein product [Timema tahoe]
MSEAMLQYKYDYATQIMDIGPHGLAHGVITDLHVNLDIILNTSNTSDITVALQDLTLEHAGHHSFSTGPDAGACWVIDHSRQKVLTRLTSESLYKT